MDFKLNALPSSGDPKGLMPLNTQFENTYPLVKICHIVAYSIMPSMTALKATWVEYQNAIYILTLTLTLCSKHLQLN